MSLQTWRKPLTHVSSQFTRESDGYLPDIDGHPVSLMPDINFTVPGNEKSLNNLNHAKTSGPDLVSARILKLVSKEVAPVLCVTHQQSYSTSQVPLDWKHANVTAVFKKATTWRITDQSHLPAVSINLWSTYFTARSRTTLTNAIVSSNFSMDSGQITDAKHSY